MLCLAGAHDPELIFLDEPTAGLDVETRDVLHSLMREWKAAGKTLVLATHDMAEAEKLADRALVLIRGRQAACASPRELTSQGNIRTKVSLVTRDDSLLSSPPRISASSEGIVVDRALLYETSDPGACVKQIVDLIQGNGDALEDLRVERPSLEERFLELVKESA
jgi:ABC-2 type transport system ATP-binding protein